MKVGHIRPSCSNYRRYLHNIKARRYQIGRIEHVVPGRVCCRRIRRRDRQHVVVVESRDGYARGSRGGHRTDLNRSVGDTGSLIVNLPRDHGHLGSRLETTRHNHYSEELRQPAHNGSLARFDVLYYLFLRSYTDFVARKRAVILTGPGITSPKFGPYSSNRPSPRGFAGWPPPKRKPYRANKSASALP